MATVVYKHNTGSEPVGTGTVKFKKSANTPDYSTGDWYINPDLSLVIDHPVKYWKIESDIVLLMTPSEQVDVDSNNVTVLTNGLISSTSSEGYSSTTSNSGSTKVFLQTPILVSGTFYEISWYCEYSASKNNKKIKIEVLLNDQVIGTHTDGMLSRYEYQSLHGSYISNDLSGNNAICIKYYDDNNSSGSVCIKSARLLIGIK